jgi:hypothetical protein
MTRLAAALWPSHGSSQGATGRGVGGVGASMARYFFHLTNGDELADEVGEEFDFVEAAQRHAMAMARELSGSRRPDAPVEHHISVVDEGGVEVFKVPV